MQKTRPAYSLMFALILMTVILVVAGAAIQNTSSKVALYAEMEGSSQAYLAAQSSAEMGVDAIQDANKDGTNDYSPGYEVQDGEVFCEDAEGDGDCNSWGDFIVLAEQKAYGGLYYTPIFGTGTAGNSENCSVLDYIDLEDGDTKSDVTIDLNDPCHWNKLLYGDSVTIPLFDTDDATGEILTPAELAGFTGWNLKIRTPCSDGTMDSDCERYELDDVNNLNDISGGDSVILWQLIGEDIMGNKPVLIPDDTLASCGFSMCREDGSVNNEIYEGLINEVASENFVVLKSETSSSSAYYPLNAFTIDPSLVKISLQLDIIHPLEDVTTYTTKKTIPYIEWQLEFNASEPVADTKSVIVGEGFFDGMRNIFYYPYLLIRRTTGDSANIYTLSN